MKQKPVLFFWEGVREEECSLWRIPLFPPLHCIPHLISSLSYVMVTCLRTKTTGWDYFSELLILWYAATNVNEFSSVIWLPPVWLTGFSAQLLLLFLCMQGSFPRSSALLEAAAPGASQLSCPPSFWPQWSYVDKGKAKLVYSQKKKGKKHLWAAGPFCLSCTFSPCRIATARSGKWQEVF